MSNHNNGQSPLTQFGGTSREWQGDAGFAGEEKVKLTVLVIDDDEDDMEMIIDALNENEDVEYVATASEAAKAIVALKEEAFTPDMIFLDINMPVINGFEFQEALKGHRGLDRIPIVFLTTSARETDVSRALKSTAMRYIIKPDRFVDLLKKLQEVTTAVLLEKTRPSNTKVTKIG